MDDATRLARLQDWLRVARSGALGDHLVRCTWSQIADDVEFHVYPERSNDDEAADSDREDEQQAEAGTGVGPGSAESEREADEALTCLAGLGSNCGMRRGRQGTPLPCPACDRFMACGCAKGAHP